MLERRADSPSYCLFEKSPEREEHLERACARPRQVCEAHGEFHNGLQVFPSRLRSGFADTEFKRGLVPHDAAPETHLPR
jgi:hypothetical protein